MKQKPFAPHRSLPQGMNREEMAEWLKRNAVEEFLDVRKHFYTEEQLLEFKETATLSGREINRLSDLKDKIGNLISKGTGEVVDIEIPTTVGVKSLTTTMREHLDMVEKGYEEEEIRVFGIPVIESETMEYFEKDGTIMADRSRPLSAREIQKHIGMFSRSVANVSVGAGKTRDVLQSAEDFENILIKPDNSGNDNDDITF